MSDETQPSRCGTYAEYQQHRRRGETPCPECTKANREYQRQLRQRDGVRDREIELEMARNAARVSLARLRPSLYAALYAEEMEARGL